MKGLKIVVSRGRVYAYHRASRTRLTNAPRRIAGEWVATPELLAEVAAIKPRRLMPDAGTLHAMVIAYRQSPAFRDLAPLSQQNYGKVLEWMRNHAGDEHPERLTAARAREIRDTAAKRGYRAGRYVVQVCRVLWKFGVEYDYVTDNPWRHVSLPKRPKGLAARNRPWSAAEVRAALEDAPRGLARAYALCLMGFRPSEVPGIPWTALTDDGIANVSDKTDFDTVQAIPETLAPLFEGERTSEMIASSKTGRAFPTANALYGASRDFLKELRKAGKCGEGLTIKGLNHTLGSALAERGVDIRTAKDAMQKRTLTTALHYSRRAETRQNARAAIGELDFGYKISALRECQFSYQKSAAKTAAVDVAIIATFQGSGEALRFVPIRSCSGTHGNRDALRASNDVAAPRSQWPVPHGTGHFVILGPFCWLAICTVSPSTR